MNVARDIVYFINVLEIVVCHYVMSDKIELTGLCFWSYIRRTLSFQLQIICIVFCNNYCLRGEGGAGLSICLFLHR